jgi:hypothetical protein
MIADRLRDLEVSLRALCRRVQVLGALSPVNFGSEVARLEAAWRAGREETPRFLYGPLPDLSDVARSASAIADGMSGGGEMAELYAARASEIALEAELVAARGRPEVAALATRRFAVDDALAVEADALAALLLSQNPERSSSEDVVVSDDTADPRSLVCRARAEIGRLRLPVRVAVAESLAPLAAAGDRLLQIGAGRRCTVTDVERTVLHEVRGHLLPMHRAASMEPAIFETGSARGSEGQEGYALLLESRAGYLRDGRARELALRHLAARAVHAGASFVETARLVEARGAALPQAMRIAARAHRGGGLGREAGYLPAYVALTSALARQPKLEAVVASGRFSIGAAAVLMRLGVVTSSPA